MNGPFMMLTLYHQRCPQLYIHASILLSTECSVSVP